MNDEFNGATFLRARTVTSNGMMGVADDDDGDGPSNMSPWAINATAISRLFGVDAQRFGALGKYLLASAPKIAWDQFRAGCSGGFSCKEETFEKFKAIAAQGSRKGGPSRAPGVPDT